MSKIHLIEKDKNFKLIDKENQIWDSCCWAVTEENAKKLINGDIFFHEAKDKPSYFGGKIISFRILNEDCDQTEGEVAGRVVFTFKFTLQHKGVKSINGNWTSMEKNIIWDN